MDRARDWGTRIQHEATLHAESSFLTLTYRDESLPPDNSLQVRDLQLFIKRLRKKLEPHRIRFYACGEYGDRGDRPHYHLIVFGYDFPDKKVWRKSTSEHLLYRSKTLEEIWPHGHSEIGTVTAATGAYVARYCLKKVTGPHAEDYYLRPNLHTGEIASVHPEFAIMSTRPGIGYGWFAKYETDAFPSCFLVLNGKKVPVPRYYKNKLRNRNADDWGNDDFRRAGARARRHRHTDQFIQDNTDERLAVREKAQQLKGKLLKRDLDEGK